MNKQKLKAFLVAREAEKIKTFENSLDALIADSQIDYNETRDEDDYAHHYQSSTDSNVAHRHLHVHTDHLKILQNLDVSPSEKVEPGAVVQVNGHYMVVAVAESAFEFEGEKVISISTASPVYQCMKDKRAGETCRYNRQNFTITRIF